MEIVGGSAEGAVQERERVLLDRHFDRLSGTERIRQLYYDSNTGLPNEKGWEAMVASKVGPQELHVHYSIEGVAWVNDAFGHEAGQKLYRAAAQALNDVDRRVAKVGGDFMGRAETPEDVKRLVRFANRALPAEYQGLEITAAWGRTPEKARAAHERYKRVLVKAGVRAERGTKPHGLAIIERVGFRGIEKWTAKDCVAWYGPGADAELPGRLNGTTHPEMARAYAKLERERSGKRFPYRDELTGLLAPKGMEVLEQRGDEILAIDVDGLGTTNGRSRGLGDEVLRRVGEVMKVVQEDLGIPLNAAHPHGDEFGASHPDATVLREFAEKVRAALAEEKVSYTDPATGRTYTQDGIRFSYGVGPSRDVADGHMQRNKSDRARAGERDPKGQRQIAAGHISERSASADELVRARNVVAERARPAPRVERVALGKNRDGPMVSRLKRVKKRVGRGDDGWSR